jgi:hypothetical protein
MLKREIIVETDVRVNGKNKHNREVFYIIIQRAIRNTSQMIFFFVPDKKGSKNDKCVTSSMIIIITCKNMQTFKSKK